MKKYTQIALFAILGFSSGDLLVSCAPKGSSDRAAGPLAQTASENSAGQKPPISANGTSDSGGGTGIDGKVFESYIVDPTLLPAYTEHLKALLKNIKREDSHPGMSYEGFFKMKTWYVAPVALDKINKDVLGISFVKSDTQQIARQTSKEVWIDKRIYDRDMNSDEQSKLLLHELVMNMYFLKFMTVSEICKVSSLLVDEKDNSGCLSNETLLDKVLRPEKAHPLTEQDNENIRFVTGWILQNATKSISEKDLTRVLYHKGFDKRFFKLENAQAKLTDMRISKKEFFQAVNGAALSGNMPDVCFALSKERPKTCKVELEEKQNFISGQPVPGLNLRVSVDHEEPINIRLIAGDEITLSASQSAEDGVVYTYGVADWNEQFKVGDRLHSGFLIFKLETAGSSAGLILESLILRPGIVVSIDKTRNPICLVRTPKVVNFLDDVVAIRKSDAPPSFTEQMFAAAPPFSLCGANNVAE